MATASQAANRLFRRGQRSQEETQFWEGLNTLCFFEQMVQSYPETLATEATAILTPILGTEILPPSVARPMPPTALPAPVAGKASISSLLLPFISSRLAFLKANICVQRAMLQKTLLVPSVAFFAGRLALVATLVAGLWSSMRTSAMTLNLFATAVL
jgi:hypothetical protein